MKILIIATILNFLKVNCLTFSGLFGRSLNKKYKIISNPNKMEHVSTFKDINVSESSIVFIDIDDTILDYGEQIDEYWKQNHHDPEYEIWYQIMRTITPKLTDPHFHDFINLLKCNNCEIYLITARNKRFSHKTYDHLKHHNIHHLETHHLSGYSKAKYIKENFDYSRYSRRIFIDDSLHNKKDIDENLENFETYIFKKRK